MTDRHFSTYILVDQTAKQVFDAITNVRGWWTEDVKGNTQKLNDEFTVRFGDAHLSTQKLVEIVPDNKVVWLVTDAELNFVKDKREWRGTRISFEVSERNNRRQVRFTHYGLVPDYECFEACSNAWSEYIHESLFYLITTGEGRPAVKEAL